MGKVSGRGPYRQTWLKEFSGETVELVKRSRGEAAKDEQRTIDATDPNVAAEDRPRLSGQNAAILERLRRGPATNAELATISLKYTSRLSDLRKNGYTVESRKDGGTWVYTLR